MFEYVLVVYLFNDYKDPEYVGHFLNCELAYIYKDHYYPNHQSAKCLLQEYIMLPEGLEIKEII